MKKTLALAMSLVACNQDTAQTPAPSAPEKYSYPVAQKGTQKDTYHGTEIDDPYRWLESSDTPETRAWIDAQNALTFGELAKIGSRTRIKDRLTEVWNFERFDVPTREGGRYFFMRNSGLQNQPTLYWTAALDQEPKVLLDPNTLKPDGTAALSSYVPSHDGKRIAYGIAQAGSDWVTWKIRDVDTGQDTADVIEWTKFSTVAWAKDDSGFYYSRYNPPSENKSLEEANYFNKLYFHKLGDAQAKDALVYERPDHKEWGFDGTVTHDGKFLVITVWKGTDDNHAVFVKDLKAPKSPVREVIGDFSAEYSYRHNDGNVFYFKTNKGAPKGKLVAFDYQKPSAARDVIAETPETLQDVGRVGELFVAQYLKDAQSVLRVHDNQGALKHELLLQGTASSVSGDHTSTEAFYAFESYTQPASIYRWDVGTNAATVWKAPKLAVDASAYETTQVFYKSKDGTQVPMFITHKKGLVKNGQNPTLLYGYGGFNIPLTPTFSVANLVWMELGGIYAVANLRGGGEYGETWHKAGTKLTKQNVFDDFIAAAEYLIAEKYTSTPKLAIHGRSNGGLLVGAALTQRPELFGAALPAVGVLDMLRFHKFTIGWAWVDDYGSSDSAEEFKALRAYSPLHNVKPGTKYPATLVTTADHDDRVVPAHSFKFAAALQAAQAGDAPTLIRIETQAGHGAGKPTAKKIEEVADQFAFLTKALNMTLPEAQAQAAKGTP